MTASEVAQLVGQPAPADPAPAEPADQAAPHALDREDGPAPARAVSAEAESAKPADGRSLKVVLTLKPEALPRGDEGAPDPSYHALLSVGADGCDPLLRAAAGTDLAGILDEVPGLVAEAEAKWATQPRFPKASAPTANPAARAGSTARDAKKLPKAAGGPAARPAVVPSGGVARSTAAVTPVAPAPAVSPVAAVGPASAAVDLAASGAATPEPTGPVAQPASSAAAVTSSPEDRPAKASKPAPTGQLSLFG
jgi:hypothetical protein